MPDHSAAVTRARSVKARHADSLMAIPGVVSVGVGLSQRSGRFTDDIAIVVMVQRKRPLADLPPAERLPVELEGIPVDVQEAGDLRAGSAAL